MTKKQLGQFFTKNADHILQGMESFIRNKKVVDPFAGYGDLMRWAKIHKAKDALGYDIDKRCINNKNIYFNDAIKNPLKYDFVITNPPYLNINKADKNTKSNYFLSSRFEDLYQISISSMMNSKEGILILPINFLSAKHSEKIRNLFFSKFEIIKLNYFKKPVFDDTTNNVISFYYRLKKDFFSNENIFEAHIYPGGKTKIKLEKKFSWTIGGDFIYLVNNTKNSLCIRRLVEKDLNSQKGKKIKKILAYNHVKTLKEFSLSEDLFKKIKQNVILLKAIDSGTEEGKISLENLKKYNVDGLVSKESSRHMIQLISEQNISIRKQEKIIDLFNKEINKARNKYLSLFLTNYRDNDRKRVSFSFAYKFINYLYFKNYKIF